MSRPPVYSIDRLSPHLRRASTPFEKREVSLTLTGAQWFALLARCAGKGLSARGAKEYKTATDRLCTQIAAESEKGK